MSLLGGPPFVDGAPADVTGGRKVFSDGLGKLVIGKPVGAGADEGLQFRVAGDLAGTSGAMLSAMGAGWRQVAQKLAGFGRV